MGWVLTKGLQNLREQVNAAFPERDKASDGTVGDLAHQVGTSGHNPDLTGRAEYKDGDKLDEVRAWDMDTDLRAAPATAQQIVDHIRALPGISSVLRYMIYNRKIYKASNGWKPEPYSGPSPHTEHIHFSGAYSQAADNNTSYDFRLEEIPVSLTAADKTWLTGQINAAVAKVAADNTAKVDDLLAVKIGDKANPNRTVGDVLRDQAKLRGYLVGDNADTSNAAIPDTAPLGEMKAAARAILAAQLPTKP
jgi:hypothetical protein